MYELIQTFYLFIIMMYMYTRCVCVRACYSACVHNREQVSGAGSLLAPWSLRTEFRLLGLYEKS